MPSVRSSPRGDARGPGGGAVPGGARRRRRRAAELPALHPRMDPSRAAVTPEDQMHRLSIVITALTTLVGPGLAQSANPKRPGTTVIVYDDFHKPGGYTLADYEAKWAILTLGEMAVEDTRQCDNYVFSISA